MTTAERIAGITDRGEFELLSTAVLRFADRDCEGLVASGTNDFGETIRSPLDGFRVITHTSPPKGVFVAHTTTTGTNKLRAKLLAGEQSDLNKAATAILNCRNKLPGAAAKIVLCVNERLGRDANLYVDVAAKAASLSAELEVWDRERLAWFLDFDPNGQWVRQAHFGVSARVPSRELLRVIGKRSIQSLWDEAPSIQFVVDRAVDRELHSLPTPTVTWLVGSSGFGKSTAALRYADRVLSDGGIAFYLPAQEIAAGLRPSDVLEKHLHSLHRDFAPDVGEAALRLATELHPITLVVEDINRLNSGERLGTRLASWAKTRRADGQSMTRLPIHLVVPVWPDIWERNERDWMTDSASRVINVSAFTCDEAVAAIRLIAGRRGFEISNADSSDVAAAVGADPFLIGLLSALSDQISNSSDLLQVARLDVAEEHLKQHASVLGRRHSRPTQDYLEALTCIADHMLLSRIMRPTTSQIRGWLNDNQWRALNELLDEGLICRRVREAGGNDVFASRHDRLQSMMLKRRASLLLMDAASNYDVLSDPYYAPILGEAIATNEIDAETLAELTRLNPLAMFEAMRVIGEPGESHQNNVLEACQDWARHVEKRQSDPVVWSISHVLLGTNSIGAVRAASALPENRILLLARLRNGDADAGVRYLSYGNELHSASRNNLLESAVEHARLHHNDAVAQRTLELLRSQDSTAVTRGLLQLAGYFQLADASQAIPRLTQNGLLDKPSLLPSLLWFALRCSPELVPGLLDRLLRVPSCDPNEGYDEQGCLCQHLGWSGRHGYMHDSVVKVVRWGTESGDRRNIAAEILNRVDDPDAVELVARFWAESDYFGGPNDPPATLSTAKLERRQWSPESKMRLQELWTSTANAPKLRLQAFSMWLQGALPSEQATVIEATKDPVLRQQALQWRLKSGDTRATQALIDEAGKQPFWWRFAHYVWSATVCSAVQTALAQTQNEDAHWCIADLLVEVPREDAEEILLRNHAVVARSEPLICTAAILGTPSLQKLTNVALENWKGEKCPLRFAGTRLDDLRFGAGPEPARFKALEPFLDRVDQETLESIGRHAEFSNAADWAEQNIWSRIQRPNGPAGDAGVLEELASSYHDSKFLPSDARYICERYVARGLSSRRILDAVLRWLENNLNERAIAIACEATACLGGREDASRLVAFVKEKTDGRAISQHLEDMTFRVRRVTLAATAEDREPS